LQTEPGSQPAFMLIHHSKYLIAIGFALVLVLMISLTAIGLTRMAAIHQRMEIIVNEQNVKTDLVALMRHAARERTINLHRMAVMTDAFEQDDELQKFRAMASEFMKARAKLLAMGLSTTEAATLEKVGALALEGTRVQAEVVDLVTAGKAAQANQLLLAKAMPAQNRVLAKLSELLEIQRDAGRKAVDEATRTYHYAYLIMLSLGAAAVGLGILIAWFVIRRSARIESDLFHEKERAEVTLHSIGDAVITTDTLGMVDYLNPVAQQLTGWSAADAQGMLLARVFDAVAEATGESMGDALGQGVLDGQAVGTKQYATLYARDGSGVSIEYGAAPIRDFNGEVIGSVLVFRDVTRSRELALQLTWAASHDALTGLINRREFERRLAQLLETARIEHKHHAVLYLDLDQFKMVNDTCGHMAGDELLRQLATTLEKRVRESDTLARLGGDEFGVLLEGCALDRAAIIADSLRTAVTGFRFVWQDKVFENGVSIGVVAITDHSESTASIMSAADSACYVAKDQGRNRVHVSHPDDSELSLRQGEMQWVQRISKALEEDRLRLYYQSITPLFPVACPADSACPSEEHYEVLLRMIDESGKLVPPMAFIPAAERYNMMPAIDRWVIRTALDHLATNGAAAGSTCSINLSGQSLGDEQMLDYIVGQLEDSGVAPQCICFEITETAAIANLTRATRFMQVLKGMGCRFSLDDFGSGMSSFGYLKHLRVDYLKIDGSFVRDMVEDQVDHAMVEAINRIGHVMGIRTIAEFVENDAILEKLRAMGVDYAQGYGIHKPEPLTHTET